MLIMESFSKSALTYYTVVSLFSLAFILLLLNWLSWPFLASAVMGSALFLHSLIISAGAKTLYSRASESGLKAELSAQLKSIFSFSGSGRKTEA